MDVETNNSKKQERTQQYRWDIISSGYCRLHLKNIRIKDISDIICNYLLDINILTISHKDLGISNNGKTFHSKGESWNSFAQTNIPMVANTGIYKIKWKIEKINYKYLF